MTTLQSLLQDNKVPGHCFAPDRYINVDIHSGLMESRGGYRLAAFPDALLRAIYSGLHYEAGQASRVILSNCGQQWGQEFYRRFEMEISEYFEQPLAELPLAVLLDSLQDLWATHGWGSLLVNLEYEQYGVIEISLTGSGFAQAAKEAMADPEQGQCSEPSCHLESGILASLFTALAGRSLHCVQTLCESMGAESNRFLVSTPERLRPVPDWIRQGIPHEEVVSRLSTLGGS